MLIFVHGISAYADEWQPFIKYFSERNFSCKAVNLREGLNLRKTRFRDYVNKVKANNSVACSPTMVSVKISGYFPCKSQLLKNGDQSI